MNHEINESKQWRPLKVKGDSKELLFNNNNNKKMQLLTPKTFRFIFYCAKFL